MPRNAGSPLARASEPLTRESGATSTTRCTEASASAAKIRPARQALLGRRPPILVRMEQSLIAVTPETVVRWHRGGFRLYWKLISKVRRTVGRRPTSKQVRELIFRMVVENPTWGAPRIHGELLMLSFDVSERTISGWMKRAPRDPESATRWLTFLRNHREAIAAMGFFTVPTITFSALYCFFATETQERDDDSSGAGEGADWSNGRWRRSRSAMQRRNERPKSGKWTPVRLRIELQPDCWFVREAHRYGRVEPMRPVRF
jgi:hypothetical protein